MSIARPLPPLSCPTGPPQESIVFYYDSIHRSEFQLPMTKVSGDGDASIYYMQASLFKDPTYKTPLMGASISFNWINHTIDDTILPFVDELSLLTVDGNLTAFTNLDLIYFSLGARYMYEISEAQGIFRDRSHVIIEIDDNGQRKVLIV